MYTLTTLKPYAIHARLSPLRPERDARLHEPGAPTATRHGDLHRRGMRSTTLYVVLLLGAQGARVLFLRVEIRQEQI